MYIMHPKEEFLLHLGQEQGVSNIMSFSISVLQGAAWDSYFGAWAGPTTD